MYIDISLVGKEEVEAHFEVSIGRRCLFHEGVGAHPMSLKTKEYLVEGV